MLLGNLYNMGKANLFPPAELFDGKGPLGFVEVCDGVGLQIPL